jgi:hypothetical protein
MTTKERIHRNAMYTIGVEIIEKAFCRLAQPKAKYVANEIERLHDYKVEVSNSYTLKKRQNEN